MNAARLSMRMVAPAAAVAGVSLYSIQDAHAKEAVDIAKVRESIVDLVDSNAEERGDGTSLAGTFIRLAWHSCGTFDLKDGSGGSNGCRMRFKPEASYGNNAGLDKARAALEPVKKKFPEMTYADLYTFAGAVAVEEAGGPKIPFSLGRVDDVDGSTSDPNDRLPNADMGSRKNTIDHMRQIFSRMGFSDREMVALLGAHAMGRCKLISLS
jgi:cytochrome c peroxidase